MYHYIYRIDRPTTGEWYVGIRSCKCWPTDDVNYLGSGKVIKAKVKKHGRDAFTKTILAIVETREEAARIEAALVGPTQVADRLCLNLCEGGDCGVLGLKHTAESKAKMSRSRTGKVLSSKTREKLRVARTGKTHTPETLAKMSAANLGRTLSTEHCAKLSTAKKGNTSALGRKHTDEARAKIGAASKAAWTPERRAAQAERARKLVEIRKQT